MSEKFDEEEISGDFEREYVRLTWLARYFDGDESHPSFILVPSGVEVGH